jgi:hypothetical protein
VADPFTGVRILIVSSEFIALAPAQRRKLVLEQVNDDQIARLELLTPDEENFLGVPSMDVQSDLEHLPLWPEALAHGQAEQIVLHLPSQTWVVRRLWLMWHEFLSAKDSRCCALTWTLKHPDWPHFLPLRARWSTVRGSCHYSCRQKLLELFLTSPSTCCA